MADAGEVPTLPGLRSLRIPFAHLSLAATPRAGRSLFCVADLRATIAARVAHEVGAESVAEEWPVICGRCGMWYANGDNYCRRCGSTVGDQLPAVAAERRLVSLPLALPSVVWKGLAALAATKIVEWAARAAARRVAQVAPLALTALVRGREAGGRSALPAPVRQDGASRGWAVAETLILLRRIRRISDGGSER